MKKASTSTAKLGATLKSVAANIGIMLAVTAAVKIFDALTVTVEEQQQKVDDLKASYDGLSSEFETLSAKQDLTDSEKERLDYLERRLELDKQILDAETRLLYQKQNGQGSWWDNLVANFDKNSNKAQSSSEFGYKKENFSDYLLATTIPGGTAIGGFYDFKTTLDGYEATIDEGKRLIENFTLLQESFKQFDGISLGDIEDEQLRYEYDFVKTELPYIEQELTDFYDELLLKYQAYKKEYQEYQSQIDSGVLYGEDLKHAKEQRDLWKESSEGLYEQITAIQKLLGTYDYWKELEGLEYFNKDEIVELIGTEEDLDVVTQKLEKDYPELNQWMDKNGVSVEALVNHYKNLVSVKEELEEPKQVELLNISDTVDQLNTQLKPAMDSLATTWKNIFSGDNGEMNLDSIDLLSISDTIKSELDSLSEIEGITVDYSSFEDFIKVLEDTESTEDDVKDAFDKLAQSIVDASVSGIEDFETLKDSLEDLGVVNNEIIAFQALAKNMDALKASGLDLETATNKDIESFVSATVSAENYAQAINILTQQKMLNSITGMDTSQEVSNLIMLARTADETCEAIDDLTQLEKIYQEIESGTLDFREQNRRLVRAIELKRRIKEEIADLDFSPDVEYNGSSIAGGLDSASSSAKSTAETFDWIETLISRIQRNITNLGKVVSATYRNWSTRNNALAQEMAEVNKEISVQQNAYNAYMAEAEKVGLDEQHKKLIQSGAYFIEPSDNEELNEKIDLYRQWYDKALSCSDAIEDLRANLAELAKTKFDNVAKQYDEQISLIEHNVTMLEGYVAQSETAGYIASEVYYKAMASKQEENIAELKEKYSSLLGTFDEAVKNGSIEKYSESWYDMLGDINDVEQSLQDATTQLIEFNQTLQQLSWDVFDRLQGYVSNIVTESEHIINILDGYDLHTDKGIITEEGLAVQGLHAVNYNTYMEQSIAYAEELRKIEEEIAKDPYDMELVDRRTELIELQQEAIASAIEEKEALHSLWEDGYNKMLESLQKVIDKRKELLNSQKD